MKKKTEPSFEERLNAASAQAAAATSVFDRVAADLEKAGQEKEILAQDIRNEVARLLALVDEYVALEDEALQAAASNYDKAMSVRALVGN